MNREIPRMIPIELSDQGEDKNAAFLVFQTTMTVFRGMHECRHLRPASNPEANDSLRFAA